MAASRQIDAFLADFGLSEIISETEHVGWVPTGTMGFMSPEIEHHTQQMKLVTNHHVVMFADVHTMGVTLAQLYHITDNARENAFHKKMCQLWNHLS